MDLALKHREEATARLYGDPHNPLLHLERGRIHEQLGYPDLAAADAYRALTLFESVVDPDGCEFLARKRKDVTEQEEQEKEKRDEGDGEEEDDDEEENFTPTSQEEYDSSIGDVYGLLVRSLVRCGCLRDAYEFCLRGMNLLADGDGDLVKSEEIGLKEEMEKIKRISAIQERRRRRGSNSAAADDGEAEKEVQLNPTTLNAQGYARRVLYPWNEHEPDRKAADTLQLLNERLGDVAPKCEVRAVSLPALHNDHPSHGSKKDGQDETKNANEEVSIQLGLFAKEDIAPGEIILRETSLLTATNRLHDDLCDACNGPLPELSSGNPPVACIECDDTIFCSQECHDRAQEVYHAAVCGQEGLESIGKDIPDPKDKADYLYLLLLGRAIAMAATQEVHPLELPEVKYIWGDFHDLPSSSTVISPSATSTEQTLLPWESDPTSTLPFSFQLSILQPMRILEEMGLDPFATLPLYDTWVLNTLYAKFRGTASGRLSTWDGGPEVCAVHPLWCLANHSCDPNVRWEWGAEITFMARTTEERAMWKEKDGRESRRNRGGIKKDEEILNHYCDIGLSVKERREWARGALGGMCLCERCLWEASLEE
ncbi:putative MYND domain protein [Paecilomyces variotii]|uniref:Putative MYND domain protein n=1 Tax=Byssochlamys spectabilis TaxID=264951 RepID=A0A443HSX5_BYSSP|nr:putative MYND domain protein [Paecilomyces variotii]KAJ9231888.1 hypothetical protein DTO166G5_6591 [Paecilomyces variotii]KAJ9254221.1 hypothetical protein DTO195F2_6725 [Paecilomyces variotii]KAJ9327800.1 hypothetical protein DTO027B3_1508 [Paecilomyces variotii]KAJ9334579.1 hypothetical protein DTO027B5_3599 [Paecilomyces variotii]KAJ9364534.1 hypothetical protein DTO280E4_1314 [Paecilomyces variotii]